MSFYTQPSVNLIQTNLFRSAMERDAANGYHFYQIEGRDKDGLNIWFQISSKTEPKMFDSEITLLASTLFFDKYRIHADNSLSLAFFELDTIDEINTANLYKF